VRSLWSSQGIHPSVWNLPPVFSRTRIKRRDSRDKESVLVIKPVGDFLTRIRNAAANRAAEVSSPHSRLREEVARVLKEEGYAQSFRKEDNNLILVLSYAHRKPLITGIKNVSKPGLRIYRKATELPRPARGLGISIISTPEGVMSNRQARKRGLGGEVLGMVW